MRLSRTAHPLGLLYWGKVWTLVACCELLVSFRHFRLDRMSEIASHNDGYESVPGRTLQDFLDQCEQLAREEFEPGAFNYYRPSCSQSD